MNYNISTLMEKPNLESKQEPFDLEQAGRESKLIMSMVLKVCITQFYSRSMYIVNFELPIFTYLHFLFQILKYEPPTTTSDDDDDSDFSDSGKKIERQESTLSNMSSSSKF